MPHEPEANPRLRGAGQPRHEMQPDGGRNAARTLVYPMRGGADPLGLGQGFKRSTKTELGRQCFEDLQQAVTLRNEEAPDSKRCHGQSPGRPPRGALVGPLRYQEAQPEERKEKLAHDLGGEIDDRGRAGHADAHAVKGQLARGDQLSGCRHDGKNIARAVTHPASP